MKGGEGSTRPSHICNEQKGTGNKGLSVIDFSRAGGGRKLGEVRLRYCRNHRWASTSFVMSAISDIDVSYSDIGDKYVD
jgi:hypothetical protein